MRYGRERLINAELVIKPYLPVLAKVGLHVPKTISKGWNGDEMTPSGAEVIIAASPPLAALSACRINLTMLDIRSCLISLSEVYRCAVRVHWSAFNSDGSLCLLRQACASAGERAKARSAG